MVGSHLYRRFWTPFTSPRVSSAKNVIRWVCGARVDLLWAARRLTEKTQPGLSASVNTKS